MCLSPLIAQCFVYGDSLKNSCVAVVIPDEEPVMGWAAKQGLPQQSFADLCKST